MGELAISQIDTDMANLVGWVKKDQVAGLQVRLGNRAAGSDLQGSCTGKPNLENIAIDPLNESGTVNSFATFSAHSMRCARPIVHCHPQVLFHGRQGQRCRRLFLLVMRYNGGSRERSRLNCGHRTAAIDDQGKKCSHQNHLKFWPEETSGVFSCHNGSIGNLPCML